jgi:hypothetical protein
MSSVRKIGLTAAAVIACARGASATMITQTLSFGPAATNWSKTFSFSGFNPALGTLTKVSETATETGSRTLVLMHNGGNFSTTSYGTFTHMALIKLPVTGTLSNLSVVNKEMNSLFEAASSTGTLLISGSSSDAATTTSGLSQFEVPTLDASVKDDNGMNSFTGNSVNIISDTELGKVTDELVFTYTPAVTPVPEPSSLASVAGALASLAFFWRRKRARGEGRG